MAFVIENFQITNELRIKNFELRIEGGLCPRPIIKIENYELRILN